MRRILLLSLLWLMGCSGNGPGNDDQTTASQARSGDEPTYTIRPGPIANAEVSALSGNFQLLEVGGPNAIPSKRLGGACLIFSAADLGYTQMAAKQCSKNSQCSTANENANAYCDTKTSTCWARPDQYPNARAALCNLGIVVEPQQLTPVPKTPVDVGQFGIRPGAKARVIACLNRTDADLRLNGCGSPDGDKRIELMGPIATVR